MDDLCSSIFWQIQQSRNDLVYKKNLGTNSLVQLSRTYVQYSTEYFFLTAVIFFPRLQHSMKCWLDASKIGGKKGGYNYLLAGKLRSYLLELERRHKKG